MSLTGCFISFVGIAALGLVFKGRTGGFGGGGGGGGTLDPFPTLITVLLLLSSFFSLLSSLISLFFSFSIGTCICSLTSSSKSSLLPLFSIFLFSISLLIFSLTFQVQFFYF